MKQFQPIAMETSASTSGQTTGPALSMHNTQTFTQGTRQHFQDHSQYKKWEYLQSPQGTPGSVEHYYEPLEKKAFKPGWQSIRPQTQIHQDQDRKAGEARRESRQAVTSQARSERLQQHAAYNRFNPITGQELSPSTGSWQPASDPWSHQKLGLRSHNTIQSMASNGAAPAAGIPAVTRTTTSNASSGAHQQGMQQVVEMRRERIAANGLAKPRVGGGVKELMQWNS